MPRIRSIKPEFFSHEELFDLEAECGFPVRLAFAGLWTVADREGRFKWRPRSLKKDILPYDNVDFERVLEALAGAGFIKKYASDDEFFGFIPSFTEHQHVNAREPQSKLPDPSDARTCTHVHARGEGKGREGKGREYSDTNVSGAQTAPPSDKEWLFNDGLTWLQGKGQTEQSARKLVGQWLKGRTPADVSEIVAQAMQDDPADPIAWVTAKLNRQSRQRDGPSEESKWAI